MFKGIRALAIYVTDMDRAIKFYTETLGFEIPTKIHPNLCFLKFKNSNLHIYLEGGKKSSAIDVDTSRLSFFLEPEKTVSEVYATLKTKNVKLLQEAPELVQDDIACFQFQDPDGNILEVSGKP